MQGWLPLGAGHGPRQSRWTFQPHRRPVRSPANVRTKTHSWLQFAAMHHSLLSVQFTQHYLQNLDQERQLAVMLTPGEQLAYCNLEALHTRIQHPQTTSACGTGSHDKPPSASWNPCRFQRQSPEATCTSYHAGKCRAANKALHERLRRSPCQHPPMDVSHRQASALHKRWLQLQSLSARVGRHGSIHRRAES
jgi:hypothetical protein